jgi:hypothetical protein
MEKALAAKGAPNAGPGATTVAAPSANAAKAPFVPPADAPVTAGNSPFTFGSDNLSVVVSWDVANDPVPNALPLVSDAPNYGYMYSHGHPITFYMYPRLMVGS